MRVALLLALCALLGCLGCSGSGFAIGPQIMFTDISGVYGADVDQQGFGRLAMTLKLVENTRTVYSAEMVNLADGAPVELEGVGTLADNHLIMNFDRGKDTDFYFESMVVESDDGSVVLEGTFVFPDSSVDLPVVFSRP